MTTRASREAEAYDEGNVWENNYRWQLRVRHVLECENTMRVEREMDSLLTRARYHRALDVGCAAGLVSRRLHDLGATSVLGIDVSEREVETARRDHGELQGVSFAVVSAETPLEDEFDLIVGRSVLHHIDFRATLERFYVDNLAPGGLMLFMEPGSHPLTVAFHRFVPSAHTADEWPITPADFDWMRARFPTVRLTPVNLLSFPAGIISSFVLSSPRNTLMHIADVIDLGLARRARLKSRGRQTLIEIEKPC